MVDLGGPDEQGRAAVLLSSAELRDALACSHELRKCGLGAAEQEDGEAAGSIVYIDNHRAQ